MEDIYARQWAYDKILAWKQDDVEGNASRCRVLADKTNEIEARITTTHSSLSHATARMKRLYTADIEDLKKDLQKVENERGMYAAASRDSIGFMACLQKAKPILVGPATLESLIEEVPEKYDCLVRKELPFNELFFEFAEPATIDAPFSRKTESVIGLYFGASSNAQQVYGASLYFERNQEFPFNISPLSVMFGPRGETFECYFEGRTYRFDMRSRTIEKRIYLQALQDNALKRPSAPEEILPISSVQNGNVFSKVANLCVNIVNYINARNVTIVPSTKTRTGRPRGAGEDGSNHSYQIIEIKDRIANSREWPAEGESRTLQFQVPVRGHVRRFRNELGEIVDTCWIRSHIKGPPGAPFREHRYKVLAEKIERERLLLSKYR